MNGSYAFNGTMKNLLSSMNYTVTRPESPVQGSSSSPSDYDLSPDGSMVAFRTKAPQLPKANYTASYIYIAPHDGSEVAVAVNGPNTTAPETAQGASGAPVWSHDSKKLAFTQQDGIDYESDRYKLYVADINGLNSKIHPVAENWDSTPTGLKFSLNDADLWVTSELYAAVRLWLVPQDAAADFKPVNFTGSDNIVSDFSILPDGSAFVSAATSWSSRIFYKQYPGQDKKILFTANEVDPELKGLGPKDVSDFWVKNDDGDMIQTFVFYPTGFNPNKTYPFMAVRNLPKATTGAFVGICGSGLIRVLWSLLLNLRDLLAMARLSPTRYVYFPLLHPTGEACPEMARASRHCTSPRSVIVQSINTLFCFEVIQALLWTST
jgi:Tol biopolymer transport system component